MSSGDGVSRRIHPIFATYVGDYPEQVLVTGVKSGECPKCIVPRDQLGRGDMFTQRDLGQVLGALSTVDNDPSHYARACKSAGIKPLYHPFWEKLPYTNIFQAITPDVLHQLYQGVIKHLIAWITSAFGPTELDARCRRFPPNHNIRNFTAGISGLSRVTGKEHDQICRLLLGLVVDLRLPNNFSSARLLCAVRSLLDFLFISQYPIHSSKTLVSLNASLQRFHQNKDIFVELGIRQHFNIPKLHSCQHYAGSIKLYGTTDNYNTQHTERLHIDLAKDAYRASNMKDEYPQMMTWLERKEKITRHEKHIIWRCTGFDMPPAAGDNHTIPRVGYERQIRMTRRPSAYAVPLETIITDYGATYFRDAFARYVVQLINPSFTRAQIERHSLNVNIPFRTLPVYHKIKFCDGSTGDAPIVDSIHAYPARTCNQRSTPGRFDTSLVSDGTGGDFDLHSAYFLLHLNVFILKGCY